MVKGSESTRASERKGKKKSVALTCVWFREERRVMDGAIRLGLIRDGARSTLLELSSERGTYPSTHQRSTLTLVRATWLTGTLALVLVLVLKVLSLRQP